MITLPGHLPRDIVVFPHMIVPLFVGREKSIRALEAVMAEKDEADHPGHPEGSRSAKTQTLSGLYTIGTVGIDPATAETAGRRRRCLSKAASALRSTRSR